jgi:AAA+ ATPase superfamily predicted ATPase
MKKLDNPFLTNGYYGREYFCDRENELNILQKMLKNDTNYLLISRRKLGKTALIER